MPTGKVESAQCHSLLVKLAVKTGVLCKCNKVALILLSITIFAHFPPHMFQPYYLPQNFGNKKKSSIQFFHKRSAVFPAVHSVRLFGARADYTREGEEWVDCRTL